MVLLDLMLGGGRSKCDWSCGLIDHIRLFIILNICRSVLQVFFSYQCNKISCRFERTSSDESNPIFPSWPGGYGHMLISSVIEVHIYAIHSYPGVSLFVSVIECCRCSRSLTLPFWTTAGLTSWTLLPKYGQSDNDVQCAEFTFLTMFVQISLVHFVAIDAVMKDMFISFIELHVYVSTLSFKQGFAKRVF